MVCHWTPRGTCTPTGWKPHTAKRLNVRSSKSWKGVGTAAWTSLSAASAVMSELLATLMLLMLVLNWVPQRGVRTLCLCTHQWVLNRLLELDCWAFSQDVEWTFGPPIVRFLHRIHYDHAKSNWCKIPTNHYFQDSVHFWKEFWVKIKYICLCLFLPPNQLGCPQGFLSWWYIW